MFKPPQKLLSIIGFEHAKVSVTLPTFDDSGMYADMLLGIFNWINYWYNGNLKEGKLRTQLISDVFIESVMNAAIHGNKEDPNKNIQFEIRIGENGILMAFKDEGDFYTTQEAKNHVEQKIPYPSKRLGTAGVGMKYIFQADALIVAIEENALYALFLKGSIIEYT